MTFTVAFTSTESAAQFDLPDWDVAHTLATA